MTARIFATILLLLMAAPALSQSALLPATFDDPDKGLAKLIVFPELRGDATAMLRCASQVNRKGKMNDTGCYLNTAGDEVYVTAIVKAAGKARMRPATNDGSPFAVYVQFQVEFRKVGDDESIRILNNPGLQENIDAYGEEHIAAQRGLASDFFSKVCPRHTRYLVWAKAHVAEDGQHGSYSVLPGEGAAITEKCRTGIIETLRNSVFTPAYADGEPVPSSFIEPFGN
ncbi:MAG: hypothetical protein WBM54_01695 [Woeseia sp.]